MANKNRNYGGTFKKKPLEYRISGNVLYVAIWNNESLFKAIFDLEDLELLESIGSLVIRSGYVCSKIKEHGSHSKDGRTFKQVSRIITNCSSDMFVDHINGNKLDNRKINLRNVTHIENCQNRQNLNKNNTSGVHGVVGWRYSSSIVINGKRKHIGTFDTIEEAIKSIENISGRKIRKANSHSKTGYRGVYPVKPKAWISNKGKRKYIGSFNSIEEAENAIKEYKQQRAE